MAGTFANTIAGGNAILKHNEEDLGFLQDVQKFFWKPTILKFETGTPKMTHGQDIIKVECGITVGLAEFTPETASKMMGGFAVTNIAGTQQTVTATNYTVVECPFSPGLSYIKLAGPNIATGGDAIVVKDVTGDLPSKYWRHRKARMIK